MTGGIIIIKRFLSFVFALCFFITVPVKVGADVGSIRFNDITQIEKKDTYSFNIKYPKIINTKSGQKINEKIEAAINNIKEQSLNLVEKSPDNYVDLTSIYEVKQNEKNILSILFKSTINYGGANPINLQSALTFNSETGGIYLLKDLFPADTDYIKLINDEIKKQVKGDYYKNTDFYKFESIDKNESFYIEDGILIVFFDQYAYAPRNFGFAQFIIPFYKKDFPIN